MTNRLTILAFLWVGLAHAQISEGGLPASLQPAQRSFFSEKEPPIVLLAPPDVQKARTEDAEQPWRSRFAVPVATDVSPDRHGVWTDLPGGRRVWRCDVQVPGALGLVLLFDQFRLPPGAEFYAYDLAQKRVFGAYTTRSCQPSGKFTIGVLRGHTVRLELLEPPGARATVHLNRVDYAYDAFALADGDPAAASDYGDALPCNINVNCSQGAGWQTEKKGVARILMVFNGNAQGQNAGSAWCTGTLIANTAGTGEPYFLTAHHCQILLVTPAFDQWIFDFHYESAACPNPGSEPIPKSVLGCQRISYRAETDFMLLKINPIPANYDVYFNGWDRNTLPAASQTVFIHHPQGDIKKITLDNQTPTVFAQAINWGGQFGTSPINSHWKTVPDAGIFQPGSSGSALLTPDKKIIGQLHGGSWNPDDPCLQNVAYFGRFNLSWDQGSSAASRLKEWLDPAGTGALTQNGYVPPLPTAFNVSGNIKTHWGVSIPYVLVALSGGANVTTYTDTLGNFVFTGVPAGSSVTVTPMLDTNDDNGISTFDLVLFSKHGLGIDLLDSPWKIIAMDANMSNSGTSFDILEMRKLLLGIYTAFPQSTSWRFFPSSYSFPNPTQPFGAMPPESIQINNLQASFTTANFFGVKIGDANNSADPGQ